MGQISGYTSYQISDSDEVRGTPNSSVEITGETWSFPPILRELSPTQWNPSFSVVASSQRSSS